MFLKVFIDVCVSLQAFQKGSLMISDVNEALLYVTETGKLLKLETDVTATQTCVDVALDNNVSLSPSSFCVLFILSGGTSSIALMVYMIHRKKKFQDSLNEQKTIWILMFGVLKYWLLRKNRFSRKVSDVESHKSGSHPNGWPSV